MSTSDNADQRLFWNSEVGQRWVTRAADLDAMHADVTRLLIAEARPASGEAVLDIGCGAGATTLAFAEAVGPDGRALGVDISEPLLARAEERRRDAGIVQAAFRNADAGIEPLPSGFDLAVSRFGVMFFSDPVAAFRNIASAVRPGGRMLFAAWAGPELNPWFALPLRLAVERVGPPAPQPPGSPGPMAFADRDRVVALLKAAGLAGCSAELRTVELHHPGGVPALVDLAGEIGPTSRLLREKNATAADAAAIAEGLADAFAAFSSPDGIRIPVGINLLRAERPI